jgi:sec-independent protein translocase protein TatB
MFDIGWSELLVIAVVLIVVVGPKDLPPMLRAFGKTMTRFRKVAGEFRAQFDEALKEADLDDVRQTIADAQKLNPAHSLREAMNPLRQMGNDIKADLQRSTMVERAPEPQMLPLAETPVAEPLPAVAIEPQPVIAPPPALVAETIAKPKATRKLRVKPELIVAAALPSAAVVEAIETPKAVRKPRVKASAVSPEPSVPLVTEVLSPSKPARQPRIRAEAPIVGEPSVMEPAQVGLPANEPAAAPKRASARKTASKKDDV